MPPAPPPFLTLNGPCFSVVRGTLCSQPQTLKFSRSNKPLSLQPNSWCLISVILECVSGPWWPCVGCEALHKAASTKLLTLTCLLSLDLWNTLSRFGVLRAMASVGWSLLRAMFCCCTCSRTRSSTNLLVHCKHFTMTFQCCISKSSLCTIYWHFICITIILWLYYIEIYWENHPLMQSEIHALCHNTYEECFFTLNHFKVYKICLSLTDSIVSHIPHQASFSHNPINCISTQRGSSQIGLIGLHDAKQAQCNRNSIPGRTDEWLQKYTAYPQFSKKSTHKCCYHCSVDTLVSVWTMVEMVEMSLPCFISILVARGSQHW